MNRRLIEIKKWLLDKGLKQTDVARRANVGPMTVHLVIKGFCTSRNVENVLRELGCPEELLERKVA